VICLAASACFGGPTSEWPTSEHDDDGPKTPSGGKADAGVLAPSIDAGRAGSVGDGTSTSPCPSAFDGGSDAGVGDPDDPSNPYDEHEGDEPSAPDAGCR
jgi:hypothetical protein